MMASQVGTELGKDEFGYRTVCVPVTNVPDGVKVHVPWHEDGRLE